jgi:hypothetical protein
MSRSKRLLLVRCAICNKWIEKGEPRNYMGAPDDVSMPVHIACFPGPDDDPKPDA